MAMRRLGAGGLTNGMRSAARSWTADNGVEFELAEACLSHAVGNAVVQACQRSSMLERRRPVMQAWASFLTGTADAKKGKKWCRYRKGGSGALIIRIAITAAAFEAIKATLPLGSVGYEAEANERG